MNTPAAILIATAFLVIAAIAAWPALRRARLRQLRRKPLQPQHLQILEGEWPVWRHLDSQERQQLTGDLQVFLHEKAFIGCDGLVVEERMRVLIAAQACLLLLNRDTDVYPDLATVLIYPGAWIAPDIETDGAIVTEGFSERIGESWDRGQVVLAWDAIEADLDGSGDGFNVVLHEFAHQLDAEDGVANGAPIIDQPQHRHEWARVLSEVFEAIQKTPHPLLDDYAATDPVEFFAVATEVFFERGAELARISPALYAQLRNYYRTDTRGWQRTRGVE